MVQINPEIWDQERKMAQGDDIRNYYRDTLGTLKRIDIPLHHSGTFKESAAILRVLANELEAVYLKRGGALEEHSLLFDGCGAIMKAKAKLDALKPGKQKKSVDNIHTLPR